MLLVVRTSVIAMGLIAGLFVGGCSSDPAPDPTSEQTGFGPLAVAVGFNGDLARNAGTLEIGAECVYLVNGADRQLLVWPAGQVQWDNLTQTITYANHNGAINTFVHGQRVEMGGSGGGFGEGPMLSQLQVNWVAPPSPNCDARSHWWLGDMKPL